MIRPYNDHLLIELPTSQFTTAADDANDPNNPNAANCGWGTVIGIPERKDVMYLSSYTWIAENSVFNIKDTSRIYEAMEKLMGKKVYFERRAEIGNTIEDGDKRYATIKLSKIVGVED